MRPPGAVGATAGALGDATADNSDQNFPMLSSVVGYGRMRGLRPNRPVTGGTWGGKCWSGRRKRLETVRLWPVRQQPGRYEKARR